MWHYITALLLHGLGNKDYRVKPSMYHDECIIGHKAALWKCIRCGIYCSIYRHLHLSVGKVVDLHYFQPNVSFHNCPPSRHLQQEEESGFEKTRREKLLITHPLVPVASD